LENAFKHGVETQPHKGFIHFKLTTSENFITFDIKNNYEESSNTSRVNKKTHGIGLDNLTRRLALIYPKRHSFIYTRVNGVFQASIIIDL
jgi:sensor histidine kinase YesM